MLGESNSEAPSVTLTTKDAMYIPGRRVSQAS
jgi:hypothetical protein